MEGGPGGGGAVFFFSREVSTREPKTSASTSAPSRPRPPAKKKGKIERSPAALGVRQVYRGPRGEQGLDGLHVAAPGLGVGE